jgi:hypothetical protein
LDLIIEPEQCERSRLPLGRASPSNNEQMQSGEIAVAKERPTLTADAGNPVGDDSPKS